ncbi:CDF family zinc transporter ZitB [Lonsdalea quercina]|uniref:CDF family zinc transporter ZitB n=1 Tax=Lonsdalea quercina TaxID=71657 RepID=UPI003976C824
MTQSRPNEQNNSQRLLAAFTLTALFMVVETVGGLLSGSLALLADAGHMLTDTAALLVALLAVRFAAGRPTSNHTFGFLRLTTLAAFINAIALFIITLWICWEAFQRFSYPQPIAGIPMLIIAVGGLMVNLLSFWLLHRGSDEKNMNVRAAALHVLGDMLGSVGAIAAALIIMMTGWTPIDPILSLVVSMLILRSAWALLKESLHELLEGSPAQIDVDALRQSLSADIPAVQNVHHVHLWQVGEKPLLTLHAQVTPSDDHDALLQQIQDYLLQRYQIGHVTIQMEYRHCDHGHCHIQQVAGEHHHHHHH